MSAKPVSVKVSCRFTNVALQEGVYVITFSKPGKTFYAKSAIQRQLIELAMMKKKLIPPDDDYEWPATIDTVHIRKTD